VPTTAQVRQIASILSNAKVVQIDRMLPILEADVAPIASNILGSKMGKGSVGAMTYSHNEDQIMPWEFTATVVANTSVAYISFADDYVYINEGDVIRNERTGEVMLVDGFGTRDATVDVVRGVGDTSGTAVAIGDIFHRIGTASEEGSKSPSALMTKAVNSAFQIQIIKKSIQLTEEAAATEVYHGSDMVHQGLKKAIEMKLDIENALFWSALSSDASGGAGTYPQPTMRGLNEWVVTNESDIETLTFAELRDIVDAIRKYHTSGKVAIVCGTPIMNIISDFAYDAINITPATTEWGIDIATLKLGKSHATLYEEPLWTGEYTGRTMFILPEPIAKYCKLKTFRNFGLKWYYDVLKDDRNAMRKDSMECKIGTEFFEEKKFGKVTGIVSG